MARTQLEFGSIFTFLIAFGAVLTDLSGCATDEPIDLIPDYSTPSDGDDTETGDDDTAGDDDTSDDGGGDDDTSDDGGGDDDATAGDVPTPAGDDDTASGDDDTAGDETATPAVSQGELEAIDASYASEIQIVNDNGAVSLTGEADRTTVEIVASYVGGSEEEYQDVSVTAVLEDSAVKVVVDVPSSLNGVRVDLSILAPATLAFEVHSGAGEVQLAALDGSGEVVTDSGDVYGSELSGALQVITTSGAVEVSAVPASTAMIDLTVGSGPIDLEIPRNTSAVLRAYAGAGSVSINNLNGTCTGSSGSVECTLGDGSGSINLLTGTGSIHVGGT